MNLDRAYRLLALFYSLILVIGVIALMVGGGTLLDDLEHNLFHLFVGRLELAVDVGRMLARG